MKTLSLVLLMFAATFLPSQSLAGDHLLFEQGGPTDWSIPPFFIAIGVPTETIRKTISGVPRETLYVSAETYESIRATIIKADSLRINDGDMFFGVTEFSGESPLFHARVPDEVVVQVMNDICSTFKANHQAIPPLIPDITRIFPRKKYESNP